MGELGAETASTLYVNNSYGQALQEAFAGAFEAEGGTVVDGRLRTTAVVQYVCE